MLGEKFFVFILRDLFRFDVACEISDRVINKRREGRKPMKESFIAIKTFLALARYRW